MARKQARALHEVVEASVKIRCVYCDIRDTCIRREHKERYEARGIMTRCSLTPNRPKKRKKKAK